MTILQLFCRYCLLASLFFAVHAYADIEKVFILKEIDDDHIIIVTEAGEQLLLEKWNLRFSPLSFEGKYFVAEVSPFWVTIHFEGRDSIKWSVEKSLGSISTTRPGKKGATPANPPAHTSKGQCFKSGIREPSPFLGNGGEIIILEDETVWKEISYQYLYLYEYYPHVIVCPSEGKMILGKHVFQIIPAR
jgi:hypothetical protein